MRRLILGSSLVALAVGACTTEAEQHADSGADAAIAVDAADPVDASANDAGAIDSGQPAIELWVFAGQSNMVGNFTQDDYDALSADLRSQPDVLYCNGKLRPNWDDLEPVANDFLPELTPWSFGPELSFGDALQHTGGPQIAIFKYASNGTSLAQDWLVGSSACPDYLNCYEALVATLAVARSTLGEHEVEGLVWMQGESDAQLLAHALQYQANMEAFVANLAEEIGVPSLPVFFARIHDELPDSTFPAADEVRAAQTALGAQEGFTMVDTDDLTVLAPDAFGAHGVHFSAGAANALGNRLATVASD